MGNNKETFKMTYSANQQDEIKEIRQKYTQPEEDKMTILRKLDAKAGKKAMAVSLTVGILGTLIMGFGMSLLMSDFGLLFGKTAYPVGILSGVIGIVMAAFAYPLYNKTLKKSRKKIAPEILKLTDELLKL